MNKNMWLKILFVAAITSLSGIIEITPVGTDFRFALASAVLMFILLAFHELPILPTGAATFFLIFLFRVLFQFVSAPDANLLLIGWDQFPGAFYYFLLAFFLHLFKVRDRGTNLLYIGGITIYSDVAANLIELLVRDGLSAISLKGFLILLGVSVFRVVWIVGVVSLILANQRHIKQMEERIRLDKVLLMVSGLNTEAFFFKKAVSDMEDVTRNCYLLYRRLLNQKQSIDTEGCDDVFLEENNMDIPLKELAPLSLNVAKKVHEIKKDSQRILAGLEKCIRGESYQGIMSLREIVSLVQRSNTSLIEFMRKDIKITEKVMAHIYIHRVYDIISVLNNLVANALEALPEKGEIEIGAVWEGRDICLWVADSGPGIDQRNLKVIFDPGYTTKFNKDGSPSTGIGLIQVLGLAENLKGRVEVNTGLETPLGGAEFRVIIPVESLLKGEESCKQSLFI